MSSKMEQIIDEIQEYLDSCKTTALSRAKIVVDKEEIDELIAELRIRTPEEIKRYQKIISNKENILAEAQRQAEQIISQAQIQTNELVSEHQIMQQAYAQANEVVLIATKEAQEIIDKATADADAIRTGAMAYTDAQLKGIEDILINSIDTTKAKYENIITNLQGYLDVVSANRAELYPEPEEEIAPAPAPAVEVQSAEKTIEIPEVTLSDEDLKSNE